jgi:hypothetical protein
MHRTVRPGSSPDPREIEAALRYNRRLPLDTTAAGLTVHTLCRPQSSSSEFEATLRILALLLAGRPTHRERLAAELAAGRVPLRSMARLVWAAITIGAPSTAARFVLSTLLRAARSPSAR